MNNIRLIVSDLDGTLLNSNKVISEYSISVLRRASEQGIKICFASGRYEPMMKLYSNILNCVSYLISSNGALVREVKTGMVLHHSIIPETELAGVVEFLGKNSISFVMYSEDKAYYWQPHINVTKRMEKYEELSFGLGFPVTIPREQVDFNNLKSCVKNVIKLVVYEDREYYVDLIHDYISHQDGFNVECTENNLLGIYSRAVSKKTALQAIMNELEISKEHVAAFGDYENDLSMFECAGTKVAVENAVDSLKALAGFVTGSNDADGVAKFINFNLINKESI